MKRFSASNHAYKDLPHLDIQHVKRCALISIFPVVTTLAGGFMLVCGMRDYQRGAGANYWPASNGTVAASFVTEDDSGDHTTYSAAVTYEFSVGSRRFKASTIYSGYGGSSDKAKAAWYTRKYPAGAPVTVLYDPTQPANAVLEAGIGFSTYLTIIVSFVFLFFGGRVLVLLPGEWWRSQAELDRRVSRSDSG